MEQRNGIEGVVVSKWGEDLTKYHVNDSYRCLHAYLVLGDLPSARREYDTLLRRAGEVSEALGQLKHL